MTWTKADIAALRRSIKAAAMNPEAPFLCGWCEDEIVGEFVECCGFPFHADKCYRDHARGGHRRPEPAP